MGKISKKQAIDIFKEYELKNMKITATDKYPGGHIFRKSESDDCWYVFPRSNLDVSHIGGSRVVCISKSTGRVIFDGIDGE